MFRFILFTLCVLAICVSQVQAAINYTVTPIKYELDVEPGESITLPASIRNNWPDTVTLPTTKSDFQANGPNWVPSLVRKSELVYPDQELSTWITLSAPSVTLAPGEEKTINLTIDVPANATPGGHYGAVLFRNPGSETSTSWNVWINVDYGIIILVDVEWEIIVDVEIEPPVISGWSSSWGWGGGWWGWSNWSGDSWVYTNEPTDDDSWYVWDDEDGSPLYENPDDCLIDFTPSRFDGKCFWYTDPLLFEGPWDSEIPWWDSGSYDPELFDEDFWIEFEFPVNNNGNSHVKPIWKVTLTDEDGSIIKAVGKEVVSNDAWTIIWENIVDYIPINDQWGNVLPKTKRVFGSAWEGFPYKTYNDEGDQVMNYWSPGEYYTQKNKENAWFLMFWERVCEVRQQKNITANIEMQYEDENGNPIIFSAAKEFPVRYIEQQVRINPYVILALILFLIALLLLWYIVRFWLIAVKTSKCWNCKKSIKSHWDTCPYCRKLQNKKKQEKLEEQVKNGKNKKKKK